LEQEEALAYFYQRLDAIAFSHGKTPVHWVETFDALGKTGRLDKRAVIQICPSTHTGMCGYSKTTINEVVAAGYKAICALRVSSAGTTGCSVLLLLTIRIWITIHLSICADR
jgi:hypothetical protein